MKKYKPKKVAKHALLLWAPAKYKLSWGVQNFDGPHIMINGEYGCALEEFFSTYRPLKERNTYYKHAEVHARQVKSKEHLKTVLDGKVEIEGDIDTGYWIIRNPGGEEYAIKDEKFHELYELAEK